MTTLGKEVNINEGNFINSIDSIFDAYFLISKEKAILDYKIKDKKLKLLFDNKNLQGKEILKIFSFDIDQDCLRRFTQTILEEKPQIIEINLLINEKTSYYEILFIILTKNQMLIIFRNIDNQKELEIKLTQEKNILKNIIELNPYAIDIKDKNGYQVMCNQAFIDMWGSAAPKDYCVFDDIVLNTDGRIEFFNTILRGEIVRFDENWYNPNDNNPKLPSKNVCHKVIGFPIFNEHGKVEKMVSIHEDITERKQIEKKLRESEERFRSLVETTSDWIWEVDEKGIYTYISPKIIDLLGYKPEEIIGKRPFDLMPPDEAERVRKIFQAISESQESFERFENTNLHKDGRYIILETSGVPIFNEYGVFLGYRGIDRDITERKRAEQKLEESEEKYRHLFNNTPYAIWLVNLRGQIIDCNETMNNLLSIFKYTDLIGKSFREVIKMFLNEGDPRFENLDRVFKERFKRLLKQGYLEPIEFEISRGDGKNFFITLETSFVSEGKDRLIQVFIKDITEKKLAEIELDFLRKDLENRVKERTIKLQNSEKRYRKAYNRVNCFKGLFTHDIANMFNTIGNSIELCESLLKEGVKTDNTLESFALIEQQIKRGKKLIYNIRNLSEMEESEMPLESTGILKKLRSAIQFVRVNFQKHNIEVNIESDYDETFVLANELLLDVFENILINSVNYNKSETIEINIKISKLKKNDTAYIKLEFKDNGIGIDDSRKRHIFEENYKKRIGAKGMGLGLSLVAKLLDLYEGKISIEDRIEGDYTQGSNFIILLIEAV